jgi:hypothetical protein
MFPRELPVLQAVGAGTPPADAREPSGMTLPMA